MTPGPDALATLIAKDEIRDLALLYSRGVDRKDFDLVRTLYTEDGVDRHGDFYSGPVQGYVEFLAGSLPHIAYTGHHVCNHLVSVDGDQGEGEVYALAYHVIPDGAGGYLEDIMAVRYLDRYRKEAGRWKFASRDVAFDMRSVRPYEMPEPPKAGEDLSYAALASRLFARGPRA